MEDADVQLGGGNPGCGDLITMYLKIDEGDFITSASFEGEGCTISQAGGSLMSEMLPGKTLDDVKAMGTHTIIEEFGEDVVKSRVRCATLALGTVQAAIDLHRNDRRKAQLKADDPDKAFAFQN